MHTLAANGANIPAIGFGTFRVSSEDVLRMVPAAIEIGFRHVDTAQIYGNEAAVGEAIATSGVPRQDIFLTTKVWVDKFRSGDFGRSVDESLDKLRTDYVDLLLLHWPNPAVPLEEQIGELNAARASGKARNIGVSNYSTALMKEAIRLSDAPLATNQVEYQPFLDQSPVLDLARQNGMSVTAYFAMAEGRVFKDPVIGEIGRKHGKSPAQVVLRWMVQQEDVLVLSKTLSRDRAIENFGIWDFVLDADDMARLFALGSRDGRILNPANLAPEWD
ncbi:aldo/keto reductase [Terrihabitans rhizophilus]|uniref:Aldo/keto reductase n=1 Tax=Terrihabitans rhizophilus TaxID=3092662 RepID=A0ABU4RWN3_9HYPH|nr:aldo/keto reductase [Terrihabitans sp. PJ23]MDX6807301.1 aldo/keto reductase [Terrihabitans sp. PJ23]